MKTPTGIYAAIACFLVAACATLGQAPDPARVQAKIEESRKQEIELVRATVADPVRAERFLDLLRERDRLVEQHVRDLIAHREKLAALSEDYDAHREDFEALLDDFNQQRKAAQKDTIDVVAAMKAATTADEWKTLSRFQLKRLDTRKLVYGAAQGG